MKRSLCVLAVLLAGCSSQPTVVAVDNGTLPDVESPADDGGSGPEEALDDRVPEGGDAALADDPSASDPSASDPSVEAPSTEDIAVDDAVAETADLVEAEVPALDALPDADIDACTPECGEAECGDDGCGGTCGECTGGKVCADGTCECMERAYRACCDNAVCWFDSCGTEGLWIVDCPKGCEASRCVDCTSQCEGKACGEDGCGGECGQCAAGECAGLSWTQPGACVNGQCMGGGTLQSCDDGVVCTRDRCDPRSGCRHDVRADGYVCEAGGCEALTWSRSRTCAAGACTGGGGTEVCEDGNPCTDDACDAESGCVLTPNTAPCDDGDPCTETDVCAIGTCVGSAKDCDDNNDCTTDSCVKGVGCQRENVMDGAACGATSCNGLTWTKPGACQAGTCMPTGIQGCDDSLACTTDACEAANGCANVLQAGNCLVGGACYASGDPGGTCLVCEPGLNTTAFTPMSGNACEDGNACTTDDVCVADDTPGCRGTPYSCDDGLACTTDTCDGMGGCANVLAAGAPCDDGNACTRADACAAGPAGEAICVGTAYACDDGKVCTTDSCDATGGCVAALQPGNCLVGDTCYAEGQGEPGNVCRACTTASSTSSWSPVNQGATCAPDPPCEWGACGAFADPCDETGTRQRSCVRMKCKDGQCAQEGFTESGGCSRDTDGWACTPAGALAGGSCASGGCSCGAAIKFPGAPCSGQTCTGSAACNHWPGSSYQCTSNCNWDRAVTVGSFSRSPSDASYFDVVWMNMPANRECPDLEWYYLDIPMSGASSTTVGMELVAPPGVDISLTAGIHCWNGSKNVNGSVPNVYEGSCRTQTQDHTFVDCDSASAGPGGTERFRAQFQCSSGSATKNLILWVAVRRVSGSSCLPATLRLNP